MCVCIQTTLRHTLSHPHPPTLTHTTPNTHTNSIIMFHWCTKPAMDWLLHEYAAPVYGPAGVAACQQLLLVVHQVAWLLPVYLISLLVSCIW